VQQSYAEAVHWFRRAADQGFAVAQYNLGILYANGDGVLKDDTEAVKWYRKAAEQGLAQAQSNLGSMYVAACGVPQDYTEAVADLGPNAGDVGPEAAQLIAAAAIAG
jgi:TPR repeat protein